MDPTRFDLLTKRLAAGATSRRRLLTGLGGALAALMGRRAAAAPPGSHGLAGFPGVGASCSADADCLDGRCVNGHCRFDVGSGLGGCRSDSDCPAGTECGGLGRCIPSCHCDRDLASSRERFQVCFNNKAFCDRPQVGQNCCQFCAGWVGCAGPFDTGTSCGRVTGTDETRCF